jgi:hypothetical protein
MQEFESISASSYDPSALATKLTAKAAEGWKVVAIVPTGGDVTAYVSRESDAAAEPKKAAEVVEKEAVVVETVAADEPESEPEPAPVKIEAESKPEVSEPSGWAIAPEPATPASEPSVPAAAATVPSYQPTITPTPASTSPSAVGPSAVSPAAATPAAASAPAASVAPAAPTPAVPAGWYADPAGRFELRYWDGTTWTEHVSRTGQQFTDPPVA